MIDNQYRIVGNQVFNEDKYYDSVFCVTGMDCV